MCRMLAYAGPPRSLEELLIAPPHSLEVQSYAPKQMEEAILNADGFGVAWYAPGVEEPARYRTVMPMWADENVRTFGKQIRSGTVLAAVRSATPGIAHSVQNTQPFGVGPVSFLHNGFIRDFRDGPMRAIRRSLGDQAYRHVIGTSDSEHLFALFLDGYLAHGDLERGVREMLERCDEHRHGHTALLAVIVSDGERVVAVRQAFDGNAPTLYRHDDPDGAVFLASEPLTTDGGWSLLEERVIVTVTKQGARASSGG